MNKDISSILELIQQNNLDKAFQVANSLFEKNNTNHNLIKILAYIYMQKNNFAKSEELLKKGLSLHPSLRDFDYFNNLGYCLLRMEEYQEALSFLEKAKEVNQDAPSVWTNFSEVFLALRDFNIAREHIDIAISKIDIRNTNKITEQTNVFWMMSAINTSLKRDDDTINMFIDILKNQFNENIFFLLSTIKPGSIASEILEIALDKIKLNQEKFENKLKRFYFVTPLYFGLANYYHYQKDKFESEKFYHLGNKEIFNSTRYNSFAYQKKISKSVEYYEHNFLNFESDNQQLGQNNFFIVGSPRSGTTLLESIVTANEEVFSGGELTSAKELISRNIHNSNFNVNEFYKDFTNLYLKRTDFIKGNHDKIVDKLPENFLYLGILLKFLPGTKIIRIFRNPWDIAISLYKQRYVQNIPYSSSFFNIGVFLANFEAINLYWNKILSDTNSNAVMDVYYEDLVHNQEMNQKEIYNFLGLKSEYSSSKRAEFFSTTASMRQVQGSIYQKSVDKREFEDQKNEFIDALQMQRTYWKSKDLYSTDNKFFGYDLS